MSDNDYESFLARKAIFDPPTGLTKIPPICARAFPFQKDIVKWALKRGRAAIFAGTGLGKSLMELAWADAIHKATGKSVLHLAPLAVAPQMIREALKFNIPARHVKTQADVKPGVNVTNYHKLDHFDVSSFGGIILDESSILKNESGHYRNELISACADIPFRLAATATPAPNDFMELGNHAEFLGVMSYTDMLATFFTHDGSETQKWRLKGHAEQEFWKWMASWAVMLRKPSDLGYADDGYDLPPLNQIQHVVAADYAPNVDAGTLFPMQASSLQERIAARRGSVDARCDAVSRLALSSFDTKLATWHGNQNTQSSDALNINQTNQSESDGAGRAEAQTKTSSTWPTTTSGTRPSSNEPRSSKRLSISAAESDTLPTPHTAKSARNPLASDPPNHDGLGVSSPSTECSPQTTTHFSHGRTASAPSVSASQSDISTLTTAIKTAASVGFFATRVIPASVISEMTKAGLLEPWCIWCNLNSEQDALARAFGPLAFSISGSTPDEEKERAILEWIDGKRPVMLSKPSIMGFGMNFQHCANTAFVGLNDSFEQVYQAIRRFWRFGQTKPVNVHFVASEIEGAVVANLKRKEADADRMAASMVMHTADLSARIVRGMERDKGNYNPAQEMRLPAWLEEVA